MSKNNSKKSQTNKKNKKIRRIKRLVSRKKGGALINMNVDFRNNVYPTLPKKIGCPVCGTKHKKKRMVYDVNNTAARFSKRHPKGVRVYSYKLPSRRRIIKFGLITGTVFYFVCKSCNFIFTFKNRMSEDGKASNNDDD